MLDNTNSDMKTWLNASLSRHLKNRTSLEDVRTHLIGSMLVQILLYYRYDIPSKWEKSCSPADSLSLGKGLTDTLAAARCCGLAAPLTEESQEIYEALDVDDWINYSQMSAPVWRALTELSGLDKEGWESLPSLAQEALSRKVTCTCCGYADDIYCFGEVMEFVDPFTFGGGDRIIVRCKRCLERIVFDPVIVPVKKSRKMSEDTRVIILATGSIVLLLVIFWLIKCAL